MQQWNDFKEKMEHEFDRKTSPYIHISLLKEGYKLDGQKGIKTNIGFNQYKSVDYIADTSLLALVEFSDLLSQQNSIMNQIQRLKDSDFSNKDSREVSKSLRTKIQKELVDKYKDSLLIIEQMQKSSYCSQLAEQYQKNETLKEYWVVIAPFHPSIEKENRVELAKFLDQLKNNITTALPKVLNITVRIVFVHDFANPKLGSSSK